ncbi:MFS transporter [Desulfovibrio aminophilus]|uniref:MFS transporter n=1 Tax=Desulfovibrio aminophilus TaxID=81425 RepID=UPI0003FAE9FF|nr:MFS transporter [Desulfovibrio aminophilus]
MKRENTVPAGQTPANTITARRATWFVVLLGIVSLFADMTYEGARGIIGPYLALLGASATVVGVVAGLGELLGYALRLVSGRLADRTGRYWLVTICGYLVNLLAVPLLAITGHWQYAVLLMFAERVGKALRSPPRDAMLSFAGKTMGRGWGFALHEAMDQTGATIGPLLMAGVIAWKNGQILQDYQFGFGLLLIPALLSLGTLGLARVLFPNPRDLERRTPELDTHGFAEPFWLYLAATACVAAGFADYPLIAYHFQARAVVDGGWIPFFYALAMAVDGAAALVFGAVYDRRGMGVLIAAMLAGVLAAPLLFLGGFAGAICGVVLWGVGMGAQESVMKAVVAAMSPAARRGSAFGVFNMSFGVFWFAGSALMGVLYDMSIPALVSFSVVVQFLAIPLMLLVMRRHRASTSAGHDVK